MGLVIIPRGTTMTYPTIIINGLLVAQLLTQLNNALSPEGLSGTGVGSGVVEVFSHTA